LPTLSTPELTKLRHTLGRALSVDEVNQLGRDTGQAERLRTVTPHRLFLAVVSTLGSGHVESMGSTGFVREVRIQRPLICATIRSQSASSKSFP